MVNTFLYFILQSFCFPFLRSLLMCYFMFYSNSLIWFAILSGSHLKEKKTSRSSQRNTGYFSISSSSFELGNFLKYCPFLLLVMEADGSWVFGFKDSQRGKMSSVPVLFFSSCFHVLSECTDCFEPKGHLLACSEGWCHCRNSQTQVSAYFGCWDRQPALRAKQIYAFIWRLETRKESVCFDFKWQ